MSWRLAAFLVGLIACGDNIRLTDGNHDRPPHCGDGVRDPDEECDDGNRNETDRCRDCRLPFCGDGVRDPGEACDDGNADETDDCRECALPFCGDAVLDRGEECDDGNAVETDDCRHCALPRCGDQLVDPGEECDDGNLDETDQCRRCALPACGDGVVDTDEACDDGNSDETDACRRCLPPGCGDAVLDPGEECDQELVSVSADGCSSTCVTELGKWTDYMPPNGPYIRDHAMAYDAARGRMIVFGGAIADVANGPTSPSDRTFEWIGAAWVEVQPATRPSARVRPQMVYDVARQRIVLFGGSVNGVAVNETWEWDGTTWTQRFPIVSPPARARFAMTYDVARSVTIVVGGSGDLRSTWEWDGTNWTQRNDAPIDVLGDVIAYAGTRGVILCGSNCDAMWSWNGLVWTPVPTPPTDWNFAQSDDEWHLRYDPSRDRMLFVGAVSSQRDGLLVYESDGSAWTPKQSVAGPYPRYGVAIAFDAGQGTMMLSGGANYSYGIDPNRPVPDTWQWDGALWLLADGSPQFRVRDQPSYDARRGVHVFLDFPSGGTWEGNGDTWTQRSPTTSPPKRTEYSLAYDEARDRTILVGGREYLYSQFGNVGGMDAKHDMWAWDGTNWTQLFPAHLPTKNILGSNLAYAYDRKSLLLFATDELWEWDGNDWTKIVTAHTPNLEFTWSLAYDAKRRVAVLTGLTPQQSETWLWDGVDWQHAGSGYNLQTVYDPQRQRVVNPFAGVEWDGTSWVTSWTPSPSFFPWWVSSYDRVHQGIFAFSNLRRFAPSLFRYESSAREVCDGTDGDGDTLIGCNDPDCWGRCNPLCLPGTTCDPNDPHCGDGTCSVLESNAICPSDCP